MTQLLIPASNPTQLLIQGLQSRQHLDALRQSLTYSDHKARFAYENFKKKGGWYASKHGQEAFEEELQRLKGEIKRCLLNVEDGECWTQSGLSVYVSEKLGVPVENQVVYPEPNSIAWAETPRFEMYPYQQYAMEKLLKARHAGVEMGTGLGKSFIIANLIRRLGLKTLVMTPATQISEQLYEGEDGRGGFRALFGRAKVGAFFDGKKELSKLITVANAQSLVKVEAGSPAWEELQKVQVFIADESHQCPAQTLASVCFGAVKGAPYRFFFSATQMRNDGLDLLLDAITGPIVYKMTVRQGVDQGYLAKPLFRMFKTDSSDATESQDVNKMTRKHLLYNPKVTRHIGSLVNAAVASQMPVLVLIDEVEQFTKLLPYLKYPVGFAHGPLNDDNRPKVPTQFWDSDPGELVKEFNAGKLPILVGTSCISTGTDVRAVKFLVYWQGGKSEIQVKQAIGRGTRLVPGKSFCHVVDYDVENKRVLNRHAQARRAIYNDLYGPIRETQI